MAKRPKKRWWHCEWDAWWQTSVFARTRGAAFHKFRKWYGGNVKYCDVYIEPYPQ